MDDVDDNYDKVHKEKYIINIIYIINKIYTVKYFTLTYPPQAPHIKDKIIIPVS